GAHPRAAVTANQPGLAPFLVNGRPVKASNHWDNKRRARLQAQLPAGVCASHQLERLTERLTDTRNRQIAHALHVASRRVVHRLAAEEVATLVIGRSRRW